MKGSGLFEEGLTLGLGQEVYLTSLGYLIITKSKEVLKQTKQHKKNKHNEASMSKGHRNQLKKFPIAQTGKNLSKKIKKYELKPKE